MHLLKALHLGVGTALLFTLHRQEPVTWPHPAAQKAGKCSHWVRSPFCAHLSTVGIAGWASLCGRAVLCTVGCQVTSLASTSYMLVTHTYPAHGKQSYLQTLSNVFWEQSHPLVKNCCSIAEEENSGEQLVNSVRERKFKLMAQFLVPTRRWAPPRQEGAPPPPGFCLLQNSHPHPLHPEQHLTPWRYSIHSYQLTRCALSTNQLSTNQTGPTFTIQTYSGCFPWSKPCAHKGCPLSLHQEMLLIIILITILKAQIHQKQTVTWDLSTPTPTSSDIEPLVLKVERCQLRLLFHGGWFHLPEGPPGANPPAMPNVKLLPSLKEDLIMPEAATCNFPSAKWDSMGF